MAPDKSPAIINNRLDAVASCQVTAICGPGPRGAGPSANLAAVTIAGGDCRIAGNRRHGAIVVL